MVNDVPEEKGLDALTRTQLSIGNEGVGGRYPIRGEMDGTEPLTNYGSKNVMIAAERRDTIIIPEVIERVSSEIRIPDKLTVIRRTTTYYGPELMLHAEIDDEQNYLLNAPGPDAYLLLWKANIDDLGVRRSYSVIAEVKADIEEGSAYKLCPNCGQPFRTIGHERAAALGACPNI